MTLCIGSVIAVVAASPPYTITRVRGIRYFLCACDWRRSSGLGDQWYRFGEHDGDPRDEHDIVHPMKHPGTTSEGL
jgi:hypothetical protein